MKERFRGVAEAPLWGDGRPVMVILMQARHGPRRVKGARREGLK